MRILYQLLSAFALTAALLGISIMAYVPKALALSFFLSVLCNLSFAVGAFARATVLKGQERGRELPNWQKLFVHCTGLSVAAMIGSVLAF
jgi:hypothetical protein